MKIKETIMSVSGPEAHSSGPLPLGPNAIQDPNLANVMGYAEYPYFEALAALERNAAQLGVVASESAINALNSEANKAGYDAGVAFVGEKQTAIGTLRAELRRQEPAPTWNVYNSRHSSAPEHSTELELTREEGEFRKSLLERLTASHATYETGLGAINKGRRLEDRFGVATIETVKALAEKRLSPAVVRELYAECEAAKANPIEHSPTAGYDIILVPNVNLTERDEDNLANAIQQAVPVYDGKPFKYPPLHNTPHQATGEDSVRVIFAPRHLTLKEGTAAEQSAAITARNNDKERATTLCSGDDFKVMMSILHTIRTNPDKIDWKDSKEYNEARFWATYHRNVTATPDAVGCVPRSCVYVDGQFCRAYSDASGDHASRALVVPKV